MGMTSAERTFSEENDLEGLPRHSPSKVEEPLLQLAEGDFRLINEFLNRFILSIR